MNEKYYKLDTRKPNNLMPEDMGDESRMFIIVGLAWVGILALTFMPILFSEDIPPDVLPILIVAFLFFEAVGAGFLVYGLVIRKNSKKKKALWEEAAHNGVVITGEVYLVDSYFVEFNYSIQKRRSYWRCSVHYWFFDENDGKQKDVFFEKYFEQPIPAEKDKVTLLLHMGRHYRLTEFSLLENVLFE